MEIMLRIFQEINFVKDKEINIISYNWKSISNTAFSDMLSTLHLFSDFRSYLRGQSII